MKEFVDPELLFINQIRKIKVVAGHNKSVYNVKQQLDFVSGVMLDVGRQTIGHKTQGLEKKDNDQEFIDGLCALQVQIPINAQQTNKPGDPCRQIKRMKHAANNENCLLYRSRAYSKLTKSSIKGSLTEKNIPGRLPFQNHLKQNGKWDRMTLLSFQNS
jgi:hypothetical protein